MKRFDRIRCSFVASVSTAMLCLVASTVTAEAACAPAGNDEDQNIVCQDDTGGAPFDAGDGNDRVVIKAGKYNDPISGGKGDDTMIVKDGAKATDILGGDGKDEIIVKDGSTVNKVDGGNGSDLIVLKDGADVGTVDGGNGKDTIILKDAKANKVDGGNGSDLIVIKDGAEGGKVDGGNGNDVIILKDAKADKVDGGKGDDLIVLKDGAKVEKVDGGNGNDAIILKDAKADNVDGGRGDDLIVLKDGAKAEKVDGGDGNDDIILKDAKADKVDGGKGDDLIVLKDGTKVEKVDGGNGNDEIILKDAKVDQVDGGKGDDTIRLDGATVKKKIAGGDGNDRVILKSGTVKKVEGNDGKDTFVVTSEFDLEKVDSIDGGDQEDTLTLNGQVIRASKLPTLKNLEIMKLRQETVLQVFNGAFELQVSDLLQVDETSAIDMIDGKANDKLVVPGDFASTGTLLLDAELNTVNGKADTLVIGGDVQKGGTTTVVINDVGDGSSDDILPDPINVVSVGGETRDGDFALDGPVFSGLVEYDLLLDGGDWNLVASVLDQAFVLPNIQTIVSGDTRQVIGSLRDRTTASFSGGRGPVANFGNPYTGSKWGTWIRLGGSKAKAGGSLGTGLIAGDTSYSSTLGFVQGGIATRLLDNGFSKLIASVFGHYSDSDADISDAGGTEQGTVLTNSAGVGGSLTWLSTSGWYADLLGLASWHDIDTSTVNGAVGSTDGDTLAGSLELGYSLRVNDNVNVIPQAQVVYQRTRIDGFTDSFGVTSSFSDADGVDGRFGVAIEHVTAMYMVDGVFKANGEVSVTHNFVNDSNATINDQLVGFDSEGTELLIGGGMAVVPAADGFNFGFQGDYSIPLTDDGREGFSLEATAGVTF